MSDDQDLHMAVEAAAAAPTLAEEMAEMEARTTRLVREAVSYFRADLEQDEEAMHIVRHPDTNAPRVYELSGKGDFAGLIIPVCIADGQESNLAAVNSTTEQAIVIHECTNIASMIASLQALFDQMHVGKVQEMLKMTIPQTRIADAEVLVRFAIEQVGKRVQIENFRVMPRARTYAGPLKNSPLLSYFISFEIPLSASPSEHANNNNNNNSPQQHLTVWINKRVNTLSVQGKRGVALFDSTTNTQLSDIVPFKTVQNLVLAARILVSPSRMSPSPEPAIMEQGADDEVKLTDFVPAPSLPSPKASKHRKNNIKTKTKTKPKSKTVVHKTYKLDPIVSGSILRTRQQHRMLHQLRTRNILPAI
jgi:hypothetical protein